MLAWLTRENTLFLALFLFLITLFLRTLWLDKIPIGITHDNMIFALNAKAVFHTGKDVTGLWHPLSFAPIPDEPAQAELPYTLLAPIIGPLPSTLFSFHIFYSIINSFLVVALFFIVLKLLGKGPAFITGLVAAFSPWDIFFGRAGFEVTLALFFYVLGFCVLLYTTGWKKLLAIIPLAGGFYTYMAYKTTFLPYIFTISFFTWLFMENKKYTKQYIVLLLTCLVIFFAFVINAKQTAGNRLGELSFFKSGTIEKEVNLGRRLAIDNPFENVFSNKPTQFAKGVIAKYYDAFSFKYLFVDNEYTLRFHIVNHGYFYYVDLLFLIIGFCYLFAYKRRLWSFLTVLVLLSPIPSVVSSIDSSYAMRSSLYIPFFYIFIGTGIWYALTFFKKKKYARLTTIAIVGIYTLSIANFLYTYFFIQPVAASEGTAFSARLVSRYASLAETAGKPLTVIISSPKVLYKDFIFYSDNYNKETSGVVREAFLNHDYTFKNVSFQNCDNVKGLEEDRLYIFDPGERCLFFKDVKPVLTIPQLYDSGTIYSIYQDTICTGYDLQPYIGKLSLDDFNVEKHSQKKFCETFILDFSKMRN